MVTIVLLSFYFKTYSQNNYIKIKDIIINSDTTCIVPTRLIKDANIKLIERNAFAKIIAEQDTIIILYERQVDEYYCTVTEMQDRLINADKINNELKESIIKKQKLNKIFIGTTCGIAVVTALSLLLK